MSSTKNVAECSLVIPLLEDQAPNLVSTPAGSAYETAARKLIKQANGWGHEQREDSDFQIIFGKLIKDDKETLAEYGSVDGHLIPKSSDIAKGILSAYIEQDPIIKRLKEAGEKLKERSRQLEEQLETSRESENNMNTRLAKALQESEEKIHRLAKENEFRVSELLLEHDTTVEKIQTQLDALRLRVLLDKSHQKVLDALGYKDWDALVAGRPDGFSTLREYVHDSLSKLLEDNLALSIEAVEFLYSNSNEIRAAGDRQAHDATREEISEAIFRYGTSPSETNAVRTILEELFFFVYGKNLDDMDF